MRQFTRTIFFSIIFKRCFLTFILHQIFCNSTFIKIFPALRVASLLFAFDVYKIFLCKVKLKNILLATIFLFFSKKWRRKSVQKPSQKSG